MSATGSPGQSTPQASDIAVDLLDAGLVRLVAAATGDAVAAAGLLTKALESNGVAHQTSVVTLAEQTERATDADLTLSLGRPSVDADAVLGVDGDTASETALSVATELGAADYELALAGIYAAGKRPGGDVLAAANDCGIERRPGVGVPTGEFVDGLAHTSLIHAPFSGSTEDASEALAAAGVDETAAERSENSHQRVASMVALAVCEDEQSTPRAAEILERLLRPLATPGGRFETVEGYADVLDATARERPGLAVPLTLDAVDSSTPLDLWRQHTTRAHEAVRSAATARYDGLFVVRCDRTPPLGTVARLVRDFRSPEPLVLAVADGEAAVTTTGEHTETHTHVGALMSETADIVGGVGSGTATCGRARFEGDPTEFVGTFKEAL